MKLSNKVYSVFVMDRDIFPWEYPVVVSRFPIYIKIKKWDFGIIKSIKSHSLTTIKIPFVKKWVCINTDIYAKCVEDY